MKLSKTLQVAAIFAAASVSLASAATAPKSYTLHISGSTAFRGATHNAIANILTNPKAAYVGSSLTGASQATFTGTIGIDNWTIQTSWSGSEAGVAAVAQTTTPLPTIGFLSVAGNVEGVVNKAVAPAAITGGTATTTPVLEQAVVDVVMTDVFVASTPFHGTVAGKTYSALVGSTIAGQPGAGIVGVVPFKFIASKTDASGKSYVPTSTYDGLGNMTDSLAKNVFTRPTTLSQFSGLAADSGVSVYAIGRDHDSGTRAGAVFCTGIDKPGTSVTAVVQYYPTDIDGNVIAPGDTTTKVYGVIKVPPAKVNGISYAAGASGYASGGNLAKVFANPQDPTAFANSLFVTYLGVSDAKTALAANAQEMTYNGVVYSPEAVKEGQYTFWTYEHLLYKSTIQNSTVSSALKATATKIATQIATSDAAVSGLVYDSSFHVKRNPNTTDGALVTK